MSQREKEEARSRELKAFAAELQERLRLRRLKLDLCRNDRNILAHQLDLLVLAADACHPDPRL